MPAATPPHRSQKRTVSDDHARRRLYFKMTVGTMTGIMVIGWFALMKHAVRKGPSGASSGQDATRAEIITSLRTLREELQRIPSLGDLVSQFTTQASSTEAALDNLASRIAGQATSTATTTPQTATTTPAQLP